MEPSPDQMAMMASLMEDPEIKALLSNPEVKPAEWTHDRWWWRMRITSCCVCSLFPLVYRFCCTGEKHKILCRFSRWKAEHCPRPLTCHKILFNGMGVDGGTMLRRTRYLRFIQWTKIFTTAGVKPIMDEKSWNFHKITCQSIDGVIFIKICQLFWVQ